MKKISFLILAATLLTIMAYKKDAIIVNENMIVIPNGDFENLGTSPIINPLVNWKTNNCSCTGPFDYQVIKIDSQTVFHGKYSAKLIYNGSGTRAWLKNKFAVSAHPAGLRAYVMCNIIANDTVTIAIKLLKNGATVDSGQWISTVSINNWIQLSVPITHSTAAIDSALVTITGGKSRSSNDLSINTKFWVDYLSFY